ncbi:hypothetical protein ACFLSX_01660 [Calditrichota bacterium]
MFIKYFCLLALLFTLSYSFGGQNETIPVNTKEKSVLDLMIDQPNFLQWYNFWNETFPDIDLKDLTFKKTKFLQFRNLNSLSGKTIYDVETRNFTLIYSPNKKYFLDLYTDVIFEQVPNTEDWSILGRDADPAFTFCSLKDSLTFRYTAGTTSFFDEVMWISDTLFIILGVSFMPGVENSYQKFMVVIGEIKNNSKDLTIYLSQQLPWKSSWTAYMKHKHPNLIVNF